MKSRTLYILLLLCLAAIPAVRAQQHFTLSINPMNYQNYTPVQALVNFEDGTTSKSERYVGCEVAAYCGDECRGVGTVTIINKRGVVNILCSISVYGSVRENFRFYFYDKNTTQEYRLSGVIPYDTGNKKGDFYLGSFAPEDLKSGGHYTAAGSLRGNSNIKLRGSWDAASLTLLQSALGSGYAGNPDFSGATLTCEATDIEAFTDNMAPNRMVVLSSGADEALRKCKNVVTATESTTPAGNDTLIYTARLLELNDRELMQNDYPMTADTVRLFRPTWTDGGYETCILPFVPQTAYKKGDKERNNVLDLFNFERYDSRTATVVNFTQIDMGSFAPNIPYLMRYTGSDIQSTKVDYVFEAFDAEVSGVTSVYGSDWVGVYSPYTVATDDNIYVLNSTGNALIKAEGGLTVPAFHCYFVSAGSNPIQVRHHNDENTPNAIDPPTVQDKAAGEGVIYDLDGRRVQSITHKGVFIIDGKKRFVNPDTL